MTHPDPRFPATFIPPEHRTYALAKEFVRRAAELPLEAQWRVVDEMSRPEYSDGVRRFLLDVEPEALLGAAYRELIARVTETVRTQPFALAVTLGALFLAAGDLRRIPLPCMSIYAPFGESIPPAALVTCGDSVDSSLTNRS